MVDDDEDTDCICSRCTWGGGSRVLEEMDVWKMENVFLLLATLVCTGFLNGHHSVVCPCRCCMSWEGGLKSTPRANPHQYPDVVAITKLQKIQSWKRRKAHSPPSETKKLFQAHLYSWPTSFQRTKVLRSRRGGRRGRQICGVFNCKRRKHYKSYK